MRAVHITSFGGPEVLEICESPTPQPGRGEVLVRVHASGLNRADLLQRRGQYPAPAGAPADIPGLEFAGEVEACGSGVRKWRQGQRVFGISGGGAQAEFLLSHQDLLTEIPEHLSWNEAAAIPEAFMTAHDALWTQARLRPSERVLINAVGSGVGYAAVQLARAMNAVCWGTSRTASKLDIGCELGMEQGAVAASSLDVAAAVKGWVGERGMDVVLELAGGDYVRQDLEILGAKGRLIVIGTMAGAKTEIDLGLLMSRRIHVIGTVLRARSLAEKVNATTAFANEVVPLFTAGVLKPVIDRVYPLSEIRNAHERMESNRHAGKIILNIS